MNSQSTTQQPDKPKALTKQYKQQQQQHKQQPQQQHKNQNKQQSNNQTPHIIIVCGPAGTGKTTLGKHLAKQLHAVIVDKDVTSAPLIDLLCGNQREDTYYTQTVQPAEYRVAFDIAIDNLAVGQNVILIIPMMAYAGDYNKWKQSELYKHCRNRIIAEVLQGQDNNFGENNQIVDTKQPQAEHPQQLVAQEYPIKQQQQLTTKQQNNEGNISGITEEITSVLKGLLGDDAIDISDVVMGHGEDKVVVNVEDNRDNADASNDDDGTAISGKSDNNSARSIAADAGDDCIADWWTNKQVDDIFKWIWLTCDMGTMRKRLTSRGSTRDKNKLANWEKYAEELRQKGELPDRRYEMIRVDNSMELRGW